MNSTRTCGMTALLCLMVFGGCGGGGGDDGVEPVCTSEEKKCDGLDVVKCNSAGTEWVFYKECDEYCAGAECTADAPLDVLTDSLTDAGTDILSDLVEDTAHDAADALGDIGISHDVLTDGVSSEINTPTDVGYADLELETQSNVVVAILNPVDGATVSGTVVIVATAGGEVAVDRMEFSVDGEELGMDSNPPYQQQWETTDYPNAGYLIVATAYSGESPVAEAKIIVVVLNEEIPTDSSPTVVFTSPLDGSQVYGTEFLEVEASDDMGVVEVQFFVDGGIIKTDANVPFNAYWDTGDFAPGPHSLAAIATDTSGLTGSHQIEVNIIGDCPAGACLNAEDLSLLSTPAEKKQVSAISIDCGIGCLGEDDVKACSVACIVESAGLSSECSECYGNFTDCSKWNCLAECLADPSGDACFDCQTNAGCFAGFCACSGLEWL